MSQDQIIYYNSLQQFLINKGKKNNVEKVFQTLLIERAKKSKRVTFLFDMLLKCKHNLMEYIYFYSKGKYKRQNYKVNLLKKELVVRRALLSLGKYVRKIKGIKLYLNLEKEIETLGRSRSRHILCQERNKLLSLGLRFGLRSKKKKFVKKTFFFTKKSRKEQFFS